MSQTKRFAEALKRSYIRNGNDGSSWCLHCLAYFTHTPYSVTHDSDCVMLEAQAYLAEPSPNHDAAIKAFADSIEHFRNAAKAVSFYTEHEIIEKDARKHYKKRADFYTETADTLETLKNWLEKTK